MIPECAFRQLQEVITELLSSLKANQQPFQWIHLFEADAPAYIGALENWTCGGQALQAFTNEQVVMDVRENMKNRHTVKRGDFHETIGH